MAFSPGVSPPSTFWTLLWLISWKGYLDESETGGNSGRDAPAGWMLVHQCGRLLRREEMSENPGLDRTEDLTVNTTRRYNNYCHKVSEDGTKKCSLYSPHEGLCKPNHGTVNDLFEGFDAPHPHLG